MRSAVVCLVGVLLFTFAEVAHADRPRIAVMRFTVAGDELKDEADQLTAELTRLLSQAQKFEVKSQVSVHKQQEELEESLKTSDPEKIAPVLGRNLTVDWVFIPYLSVRSAYSRLNVTVVTIGQAVESSGYAASGGGDIREVYETLIPKIVEQAQTDGGLFRGVEAATVEIPAAAVEAFQRADLALEHGRDNEARELVARAQAVAPGNVAVLERCADLHVRLGEFDAALNAVTAWLQITPPDHPRFRTMLAQQEDLQKKVDKAKQTSNEFTTAVDQADLKSALLAYQSLQALSDKSPELLGMARQLTKGGCDPALGLEQFPEWWIEQAEQTAAGIEDTTVRRAALDEISVLQASAQAEAGDVAGAKQTIAGIEDAQARSRAYRIIASAQGEAGDSAGARESFSVSIRTATVIPDESARGNAYSEIAYAQVRLGNVDDALQTAAQIDDTSTSKAQAETYRHIANSQMKVGDVAGARSTLSLARESDAGIKDPDLRCWSYSETAAGQAEAGDAIGAGETLVLAKQAARAIEDVKDRWWRSRNLALLQVKAGDMAGARELLVESAQAVQGNSDACRDLWINIVELQLDMDDVAGAMQIAAGFKDMDQKSDAYQLIAKVQVKTGDIAGARDTLSSASQCSEGYNCILVGIAQAQIGDVVGLNQTAAKADPSLRREELLTKWTVIAQATAGDIAGAKRKAESMDLDLLVGQAYLWIAAACARASDAAGAREALGWYKRLRKDSVPELFCASDCYDVAVAQVDAGDISDADRTLADACMTGRDWGYERIAAAKAEAGDIAGAMQTAAGIEDIERKDSAYRRITEMQLKAANITGALTTVVEIGDPWEAACTYVAIAKAQSTAEDNAGARKSLRLAYESATRIDNANSKDLVFPEIAFAQLYIGDVTNAARIAADMAEDRVGSSSDIVRLYLSLARAQAKSERVADARDALRQATMVAAASKGSWANESYCSIALAQAELGDFTGARDTVSHAILTAAENKEPETKWKACREIAKTEAQIATSATPLREKTHTSHPETAHARN